jgi:hypothetical protein
MNDIPEAAPSRRRGRPPKVQADILAPPQDHDVPTRQAVEPVHSQHGPTVPFPIVKDSEIDPVDLRERDRVQAETNQIKQFNAPPVSIGPAVATGTESTVGGTNEFQKAWVPVRANDVVQVSNNENKLYGTLFTVGDIRNHRVHGYQIMSSGKHEYVTVNEDECFRIGPSKVRSKNACSPKWINENR